MRQDGSNHLDFIAEAFGEKRADRAVNQARRQRFELRRPAFTLEEAARDLAGGEGLFLIVDRQREEVLSRLLGLGEHGGGQDDGFAHGGQNGAISLTGDAAGLERQRLAAPLDGLAFDIEHKGSFSRVPRAYSRGGGQVSFPKSSPDVRPDEDFV